MKQNKLIEFRKSQGLSQDGMSKVLEVTCSMYSKIEGGHTGASRKFMEKLKKHFPNVSIDELFFS